jgi:hypothetical protein
MTTPETGPKIKEPGEGPKSGPEPEPKGPRTPYPVDDPVDPRGPGSEPDYFPGNPADGGLPKMESENAGRGVLLTVSDCVCAGLGSATAMR